MKAVSALIMECPACGEGPHRVLHGRASTRSLEAVVRCVSCGQTRKEQIKATQTTDVAVIVSWQEESRRTSLTLDREEELAVGQELYVDDERVVITALESEGVRVLAGTASEVSTVWTKRFDRVNVTFAVKVGGRTVHHKLAADPYEEFSVGDILDVKQRKAVVFKIVGTDGQRTRTAPAWDIKKVYARAIRERWA